MADNKLLQRRESDELFLAEDDPLAELARIVGFDPVAEKAVPTANARREPVFDLEDELLKEFEQYATPEPMAGFDPPIERSEIAAPVREAQTVESQQPVMPHLSVTPKGEEYPAVVHSLHATDSGSTSQMARPVSHPVFELEDEILREFAAFDASRDKPQQDDLIDNTDAEAQLVPEHAEVPDTMVQTVDSSVQDSDRAAVDGPVSGHVDTEIDDYPSSAYVHPAETFVDEPVQHVTEQLQVAEDHRPSIQSDDDQGYWGDGRADRPVAEAIQHSATPEVPAVDNNYSAEQRAEPVFEDEARYDPEPVGADVELVAATSPDYAPEYETAPVSAMQPVEPVRQGYSDYGLDDLLSEVEKFPIPELAERWAVQAAPVRAEEIEVPPVVNVPEVATLSPTYEHATEAAIAVTPELATVADFEDVVEPAFVEPGNPEEIVEVAAAEPAPAAAPDPFDDGAFELDIGDIELDLSEIQSSTWSGMDASSEALSAIADAEVDDAAAPAYVPVYAGKALEQSGGEDYSSLPFDPSQIAGEEDAVEALADLDVPEMPVHEVEEKPAAQQDYDIDIDSEMAQMFTRPSGDANAPGLAGAAGVVSAAAAGQWQTESASALPNASALELDEFERALEEDFRRSLVENRDGGNPDRVALTPAYQPDAPRRGRTSWIALAASVAAIALLGGAGVYAFVSGDSQMLTTSSEPKIILADKDPVKEVPLDKGGQTVPNQNKAVYDRVSGENPDVAKQESLVSSTEEPVDVIQKTLMPEGLPEDDDSVATSTTDTNDPRLLPEGADNNVTTSNKVVSGVAPRKVRTMVVKADGTLVPREELADDTQAKLKSDAEIAKAAEKSAQDAANKPAASDDEIAKVIADVPERLSAEKTTAVVDVKPAEDVKPVDQVEPVQDVVAADVAKPIDEAAAETPVVAPDVQTETKVAEVVPVEEKPLEKAAEIQPQEVAALPDADVKPADETPKEVNRSVEIDNADALKDAASADVTNSEVEAPVRVVKTTKIRATTPIPEIRPVDQPVTVVGTVTDQGNVQNDVAPQEVAALDQQAAKPVESQTVPAGAYVIQIASLPSEAEAQNSYNKLSNKFGSVIAGRGVDIKKAQIKNKGTYYRVRIPAGSKQEALDLCNRYKQAGGSCLVSR